MLVINFYKTIGVVTDLSALSQIELQNFLTLAQVLITMYSWHVRKS